MAEWQRAETAAVHLRLPAPAGPELAARAVGRPRRGRHEAVRRGGDGTVRRWPGDAEGVFRRVRAAQRLAVPHPAMAVEHSPLCRFRPELPEPLPGCPGPGG